MSHQCHDNMFTSPPSPTGCRTPHGALWMSWSIHLLRVPSEYWARWDGVSSGKTHSGESELQRMMARRVSQNSKEKGYPWRGNLQARLLRPVAASKPNPCGQPFSPKETPRHLRQCLMQKAGLSHFLFPPHAQSLPSLPISCCPLNLCPVTRRQRFKKQQKQNTLLSAGRSQNGLHSKVTPNILSKSRSYRCLTHLRVLTSHQRTKRSSPRGKGRLLPQKACYKFQIPVPSAFMGCFSNI